MENSGYKGDAKRSTAEQSKQAVKSFTASELFEDLIVTNDDVKDIKEAEFIIDDLIIKSHVIAIVAEPNCGKTALFMHLAPRIVKEGYQVFYFNLDASAPEISRHKEIADRDGYVVIAPDIKIGSSIDDVIQKLLRLDKAKDVSNVVIMLDTLKKCTNVINKPRAKVFYKLQRGLSAKGATILMAAHANKYRDANGDLVYEGTGDLRADVDELIYLDFKKGTDAQTITTYPDKVRGEFNQLSFQLLLNTREVYQLADVVDVKAGNIAAIDARKSDPDGVIKEAINEAIEACKSKQGDIIEYCMEKDISRNRIRKALETGSDPNNPMRYLYVSIGDKNAKIYCKWSEGITDGEQNKGL